MVEYLYLDCNIPSNSNISILRVTSFSFKDDPLDHEGQGKLECEAERSRKQMEDFKSFHQVILYDDHDMDLFVREFYPEFYKLYSLVPDVVERADIWRYLIVHKYGGLYADSDFLPKVALEGWFEMKECNDSSIFISLEPNGKLFIQWGFYSTVPGHKVFYDVVFLILTSFMNELETGNIQGDAVFRTGPLKFTKAFWNHLGYSRSAFNLTSKTTVTSIKDVCILGWDFMDTVLAFHFYNGSWKNDTVIGNNNEVIKKLSEEWKRGEIYFWISINIYL